MNPGQSGWMAHVPAVLFVVALMSASIQLYALVASQRFLRMHPAIESPADLTEYQRVVGRFMHLALVQIGLIIVVPMAYMIASFVGVDVGVLTIAPMVLPMLFRKRLQAAEAGMRSMTVTDALRDSYATTNRVWISRALPRFGTAITPSASSVVPKFECAQHGARSGASCTRCGAGHCVQCAREGDTASTVCLPCRAFYRTSVDALMPSFRATSMAAHALGGLGTADLMVGFILFENPIPGSPALPAALAILGVATTAAGVLWAVFVRPGRELALAVALPHLVLVPVGTVLAAACCWVAFRHSAATSPEATEAASATNTVRSAGVLSTIAVGSAVALLHAFALVTMSFFLLP